MRASACSLIRKHKTGLTKIPRPTHLKTVACPISNRVCQRPGKLGNVHDVNDTCPVPVEFTPKSGQPQTKSPISFATRREMRATKRVRAKVKGSLGMHQNSAKLTAGPPMPEFLTASRAAPFPRCHFSYETNPPKLWRLLVFLFPAIPHLACFLPQWSSGHSIHLTHYQGTPAIQDTAPFSAVGPPPPP